MSDTAPPISPPRARARWLTPFIAIAAALAAGALLMAPMIGMEPRDIPVAIVNLDQAVDTPAGAIAAGTAVAEAVQSADAEGLLAWRTLDTQHQLDEAMDATELYAALVIPEQFSAETVAGTPPPLQLIINEGKNPMVAAQLGSSVAALTSGAEFEIETTVVNEIPTALGTVATFLPMVMMILVYIASYAGGIVIRSTFSLGRQGRGRTVATQLVVAAIAAALTGFGAALILAGFVPELSFSVAGAGAFLTIASFALMTVVIGAINWVGMIGMAVPVLTLLLGLGPADLPYEFLPAFWQDWVYPWNPLQFLATGARALLFQGAGWLNAGTLGLAITAAVGTVLVVSSTRTPRGNAAADRPGEVNPQGAPAPTGV
ncbi:ABC transporter permease [Leucobacter luti]|uniref:ABC-2 family transporter n=1 Tax=Leucobacter luti TaxID=340320 RepID=A0A4Q7U3V9_9MICO|nr:ABC transporter permease [Leucobacter luti]MBL3700737.1 hypothetical protein [Leucobacter luti]RZT68426.1 ABC-2 family transporter [Leucobacter luti]